jgi:hypothetical protein
MGNFLMTERYSSGPDSQSLEAPDEENMAYILLVSLTVAVLCNRGLEIYSGRLA